MRVLQGLKKPAHALAFAPDGRHLAEAGSSSPLRLWDIASGTGQLLPSAPGPIYGLAVAPDGMKVAVGDDGRIVVWDLDA